ncbi:DNA primase [Sphingomonas sp. ID0503]|uniref:DNA primase n=1 Tax=Sphingomonas sp. ID0503 TaxID=3399691 RepID=UPI003AFB406C
MTLSPAFLDEIRARTLLSAVIGRTTKLQKAGREYRAPCPFHNEKTPSFYVNDEKGFYHCFGCSAHGDAIRWLTDQRGLPFIDAVKELAQAAGMEMPAADPRDRERAERAVGLHDATGRAAAWFTEQLEGIEGAEARGYLQQRGITPATARKFGFGYAPDSRGKLKTALASFGDDMLVEAGLLIRPEGGKDPYDRFRGRLMIPIADQRGRPIAFGGRIIGAGEPKYLNSPETPLFDKGRTLYNLDRAGPASRTAGRVIVVEGYLDVVALDQAGIAEVVAPLGTALTEAQMERLWRLSDVPILCFDGDSAGQKAAVRAALRALGTVQPGKSLSFALMPKGQDPDDLIRSGGAPAFEKVLAEAIPLVDLVWRHEESAQPLVTPEARAGLRQRLEEIASGNPNKLVSEEYRRYFRDLFYQHYGWRPREKVELRDIVARERSIDDRTQMRLFLRSALLGLLRRPSLIGELAERLLSIRVDDPGLRRWRELLVNAAITRPHLDADGLETILAEDGVVDTGLRAWTEELRFAFLVEGEDDDLAARQLLALVETLSDQQAIDDEMARLDASAVEQGTSDGYEAVESRRQSVRKERADLFDRSFDLGAGPN